MHSIQLPENFRVRILSGSVAKTWPDWTPKNSFGYGIWYLQDGLVTSSSSHPKVPSTNLAWNRCYFSQPSDGIPLHITPGSNIGFLLFCMRDGPIKHLNRQRIAPVDGPQPETSTFFGLDLPFIINEALQSSCRQMLTTACDLWWRSPMLNRRANLILESWLLDWFSSLTMSDDLQRPFLFGCSEWAVQFSEVLRRSFPHSLDAASIAAIMGVSRCQLYRLTKKHCHATLGMCIEQLRQHEAHGLLTDSQYSIAEISLKCGFASTRGFTRWCRKQLGCTPSTYRHKLSASPTTT